MINIFNIQQLLHFEKIKWNLERVSNITPFINKYKWKEINDPSKMDD